jgi:transposase
MIELVRAGHSPDELAKEFEPTAQSIRNWVARRRTSMQAVAMTA